MWAKGINTGHCQQYLVQYQCWPVQYIAIDDNAAVVQVLHQLHPVHAEQQGYVGTNVASVIQPLLL